MNIIHLFIALTVCITVHEASHAWAAYKLGDPTAKMAGRVSLNPMRHMDLLGTIMVFIAHFGWGKPVPFNYHNLKHPRRDAALIALAGPASNLLTALVLAFVYKYLSPDIPFVGGIFQSIYMLSIVLFLFNLIPISPLDGSKLVGLVIPRSKELWYQSYLAQGPMFIILLVVFDRLFSSLFSFSILGTYLQFGYELITIAIFFIT